MARPCHALPSAPDPPAQVFRGTETNAKTVLCTRFSSPEGCRFGDRCNFAHGSVEIRPRSEGPPAGAQQQQQRAQQRGPGAGALTSPADLAASLPRDAGYHDEGAYGRGVPVGRGALWGGGGVHADAHTPALSAPSQARPRALGVQPAAAAPPPSCGCADACFRLCPAGGSLCLGAAPGLVRAAAGLRRVALTRRPAGSGAAFGSGALSASVLRGPANHGWSQHTAPEGYCYYYNAHSGVSQARSRAPAGGGGAPG